MMTALRLLIMLILPAVMCYARAQGLPVRDGDRQRYSVTVETPRGALDGVCIMMMDHGVVKASVINEFGVSLMDFTYAPPKGRVRLLSVMKMMDRWYVRRLLRRDLRHVMQSLASGDTIYRNPRMGMTYIFKPYNAAE